jgi:hypothetical protein
MRIKRILKSKTAFSAVIASLILMLIAVASGVVVYAYVMGWIGNASQSQANTGVISIDSVTASVSNSQVKLYIRNTGSSDVVLDKVYIAGTAVNNATALPSTGYTLAVRNSVYLQFDSQTLQLGRFYDVKAVCVDGTTISTSVEAT